MISPEDRPHTPERRTCPSQNEEDEGLGVFEAEEEEEEKHQMQCEYSDCQSKKWESLPTRVCHNLDCQAVNNNKALYLCGFCDEKVHQGDKSAHVRFNYEPPRTPVQRHSDDFSELDSDLSTPDGSGSLSTLLPAKTVAHCLREAECLQRKKQARRHNTDDPGKEWFTLKISDNSPPEVIPALKGKTLRDALQPAFERHRLSFDDFEVYIRSSKSPLDYECETFCLGGQHVRVEPKGVVSPDSEGGGKRRSLSSLLSRVRPFSRKVKGDHHHKINERLFKNVHRWELRRPTRMEISEQIRRSNSMPHRPGEMANSNRKDMRQFLGLDKVPVEVDKCPPVTEEAVVNGELSHSPEPPKRGTAGRKKGSKIHALLGTSVTKTADRTLEEQLEFFSVYGLPDVNGKKRSKDSEELRLISWKDLVAGSDKINKQESDQQEAIWELINTELSYYQRVRVLWEVFYVALTELQKEKFLTNVEVDRLFPNIKDLSETCASIWKECLHPLYKQCQQNKFRLHPFQIVEAFDRFEERFYPYEDFCMKEKECVAYLSTLKNESAEFKTYVQWCEKHPECKRMQLADLFGKPRNRIAQYPLLLKRIRKKTDDDEAIQRLNRLTDRMEWFLNKVNSSLARVEQAELLHGIMSKIEGYQGIEIPLEYEKYVSDVMFLDLLRPMPGVPDNRMRHLMHEGDLKLKDSSVKEIHGYIFTDMLLLTTRPKRGGKIKIVRQPLRVDRIRCERLKDPGSLLLVYLSEYSLPVMFIHLQLPSSDLAKVWTEAIEISRKSYFHACQGHELTPPHLRFSSSLFPSSLSLPRESSRDLSRTPSPFSSPGSSPPPPRRSRTLTLPTSIYHSANSILQHTRSTLPPIRSLSQEYSPSLPSLQISSPSHLRSRSTSQFQRRSFPESDLPGFRSVQRRTQSISDTNLDQLLDSLPGTPCDETKSSRHLYAIGNSASADNLDRFEANPSPLSRCRSHSAFSYTPSPPSTRRLLCHTPEIDQRSFSLDNLDSYGSMCPLETLQEEEKRRDISPLSPSLTRKFLWRNKEITLNTSNV